VKEEREMSTSLDTFRTTDSRRVKRVPHKNNEMSQSRNKVIMTTLDKDNGLRVKGPLGELRLQIPKPDQGRRVPFISLLNQMIQGVTIGHLVILKIVGIFYKVSKQNRTLLFKLGYSHGIEYTIPANIEITIGMEGGSIVLNIFGINLIEVTKVAAELKKLKPIDRYKGQGIRYLMEGGEIALGSSNKNKKK